MESWATTRARILSEAGQLAPLKVLVTVLAAPFFLLGLLLGAVWVVGALAWQAAWVGVDQARSVLSRD